MATADLTFTRLRELVEYDPATGKFKHIRMRSGVKHPNRMAGCYSKALGYVLIRLDRRLYYAHRLAWLYVHSEWPFDEIDHINGDRSDNRISNLRCVDRKTNQENIRSAPSTSASGFLGVMFDTQKQMYRSSITADGKRLHLGFFATPEEAHASYLTGKRLLHKGCTI